MVRVEIDVGYNDGLCLSPCLAAYAAAFGDAGAGNGALEGTELQFGFAVVDEIEADPQPAESLFECGGGVGVDGGGQVAVVCDEGLDLRQQGLVGLGFVLCCVELEFVHGLDWL